MVEFQRAFLLELKFEMLKQSFLFIRSPTGVWEGETMLKLTPMREAR